MRLSIFPVGSSARVALSRTIPLTANTQPRETQPPALAGETYRKGGGVYVHCICALTKTVNLLMPTTRGGHVRYLLKEKKARVVTSKPFTIQLLYETDDVVQPLYLGIDPGRTNIGVAVVKTDGTAVFTAHLETRNKEIPKLMQGRKKARRARRTNGRRCRRQRRAKANGTISKKCVKQTTAQNGSVSKRAKKIRCHQASSSGL